MRPMCKPRSQRLTRRCPSSTDIRRPCTRCRSTSTETKPICSRGCSPYRSPERMCAVKRNIGVNTCVQSYESDTFNSIMRKMDKFSCGNEACSSFPVCTHARDCTACQPTPKSNCYYPPCIREPSCMPGLRFSDPNCSVPIKMPCGATSKILCDLCKPKIRPKLSKVRLCKPCLAPSPCQVPCSKPCCVPCPRPRKAPCKPPCKQNLPCNLCRTPCRLCSQCRGCLPEPCPVCPPPRPPCNKIVCSKSVCSEPVCPLSKTTPCVIKKYYGNHFKGKGITNYQRISIKVNQPNCGEPKKSEVKSSECIRISGGGKIKMKKKPSCPDRCRCKTKIQSCPDVNPLLKIPQITINPSRQSIRICDVKRKCNKSKKELWK